MTPIEFKKAIIDNAGKFCTVTFIKKDGSERTINGHVRYVPGHENENPTGHIPKYVTMVLASPDEQGKPAWRNVNTETIKRLAIGGEVFYNKS